MHHILNITCGNESKYRYLIQSNERELIANTMKNTVKISLDFGATWSDTKFTVMEEAIKSIRSLTVLKNVMLKQEVGSSTSEWDNF